MGGREKGKEETVRRPKTRVLRQQNERENDERRGGGWKRNSGRRLRTTEVETETGRMNRQTDVVYGLGIFNIFNPHPCARARPPWSGGMRAGSPLSPRRTTMGVALCVFELRRRGLSTAAYI